ncbi:hypothetical protein VTO42DRAFT_1666 [Malbranchea cinnamomea]
MVEMALKRVTTEVNRVVAAPYPVSLKGLYDVVCSDDCGTYVPRTWGESEPCQIAPLARAVLETLRQWPYAVKLLTSLGKRQSKHFAMNYCSDNQGYWEP